MIRKIVVLLLITEKNENLNKIYKLMRILFTVYFCFMHFNHRALNDCLNVSVLDWTEWTIKVFQ